MSGREEARGVGREVKESRNGVSSFCTGCCAYLHGHAKLLKAAKKLKRCTTRCALFPKPCISISKRNPRVARLAMYSKHGRLGLNSNLTRLFFILTTSHPRLSLCSHPRLLALPNHHPSLQSHPSPPTYPSWSLSPSTSALHLLEFISPPSIFFLLP